MTRSLITVLAGGVMFMNGCKSFLTQEGALANLEESRSTSGQSTAQIAPLEQERARLLDELSVARAGREQALSELELSWHYLANERQILSQAESTLSEIQSNYRVLDREREVLQHKVEDLTVQLEKSGQDLTGSRQSLGDAHTRIKELEQKRDKANAALAKALQQAKGLQAALAADHESWTRLRKALSQVEKIDGMLAPHQE